MVRLGALGGDVHRRPVHRRRPTDRDRGGLRAGRGGRRRRRSSPTPTWCAKDGAARSLERPGRAARRSRSSAAPTARDRAGRRCRDERRARRVLDRRARCWSSPQLGLQVEQHYGAPQDIEWAERRRQASYLVQSRPDHHARPAAPEADAGAAAGAGHAAWAPRPGVAAGRVRVLRSPTEGARCATGEVLVAPMTAPDWVPAMRRAAALVTDGGGMTCHAAIVSRELGRPRAWWARATRPRVAARRASWSPSTARRAQVLRGRRRRAPARRRRRRGRAPHGSRPRAEPLATRLYVNLAMAEHAAAGRGARRSTASGCCAPSSCSPTRSAACTRELLLAARRAARSSSTQMADVAAARSRRAFAPRPVVYRTIDFRTNEFRGLEGGDEFEPHEENPMIGYRGCYRYVRRAGAVPARARGARPRCASETPNLHADDPVRAHRVGAGGVPRR